MSLPSMNSEVLRAETGYGGRGAGARLGGLANGHRCSQGGGGFAVTSSSVKTQSKIPIFPKLRLPE